MFSGPYKIWQFFTKTFFSDSRFNSNCTYVGSPSQAPERFGVSAANVETVPRVAHLNISFTTRNSRLQLYDAFIHGDRLKNI